MSNISNNLVFEKCFSLISMNSLRCPFTDTYAKKLLTGQAILLFVNAYLQNHDSLEQIAEDLKANEELQSYLNLKSVSPSTLCRKLNQLPTSYLQQLCMEILNKVADVYDDEPISSEIGPLGIVDSTEIKLPKKAGEWAYSSKNKNAIKVHVLLASLNENQTYPEHFVLSTAAVADHEVTDQLFEQERLFTYVMDRGYINYTLFYKWIEQNIRFVVRLKESSKTKVLEEYPIDTKSNIVTDAKVEMKVPKTEKTMIVRLVEYRDEEDRKYRVITNRWDLKAEDVASIYRRRWGIELFFKWMKQNIQLEKLFSYKTTAVWNQIYLAFIAFGICELVKHEIAVVKQTTQKVLKKLTNYWCKTWDQLKEAFHRKTERSSRGRVKKKKRGRPRKHPRVLKAQRIIVT